jgi:hypothetical protein
MNDEEIEGGDEAHALLSKENLSVKPKFGESLVIPYRDIVELSEGDYRIQLNLTSNEKLILFNLGYRYEDFLRELNRLRNAVLLKDMLIDEKLRKSEVEASFQYLDEDNEELRKGKCKLRVYETSIVVIPEKGEIFRIPYSDVSKIHEEDYTLIVSTEFGEKIIFSMIGAQLNPVKKALSDMMNELSEKTQNSLKKLLPEANPSVIRRAARFMKEGKAAKRSDIESVSPSLWLELEKKLSTLGVKDEYDFLKSLSQPDKLCIGLTRGLMGDLTGEYIWFLMPIYSVDPEKPGNAIAMEAATGEGGGRATYFFRIVSRKDYSLYENLEDLHSEVDRVLKLINRCMLEINFRREPIYLPDERLDEPRYSRYKHAFQKLPSLRILRQLFIGRVIHLSNEQWKEDVLDLLRFNLSTQDDDIKWKK